MKSRAWRRARRLWRLFVHPSLLSLLLLPLLAVLVVSGIGYAAFVRSPPPAPAPVLDDTTGSSGTFDLGRVTPGTYAAVYIASGGTSVSLGAVMVLPARVNILTLTK